MKIDCKSISTASSVSPSDSLRDSTVAPKAPAGARRDFAERSQHRHQVPELSSRSSTASFPFPDNTSIDSSFDLRPNLSLSNLFADAVPLTRGLSGGSGMSSSLHSSSEIVSGKPPLSYGGYRTIAASKAAPAGNVQQTAKTHVTTKPAATGSVDMRPMNAVWSGENVTAAAARFDIKNERDIRQMEVVSIKVHVPDFVKQAAQITLSEAVVSFARRYGVKTNAGKVLLRSTMSRYLALREVENGRSAKLVMEQFSIAGKGPKHQLIQAEASVKARLNLKGGNTMSPEPTVRRALFPATPGGPSGLASKTTAPAAAESFTPVKDHL